VEPPRILPLEPPFDPDVAETLAALMPPGVPPLALFRTLAHNPRVLEKIRASNLLDRGALARRDREIVILRTCARCGGEYEWGVHVTVFAKHVGLTDEEVAATCEAPGAPGPWPPRDRALLRLVDELHDTARVSDASWAELAAHFDEAQLVELLVLTGFYHTISFVVNAIRIAREPAAARFPR
jgi:alkylhydroperoxidase family enzyme